MQKPKITFSVWKQRMDMHQWGELSCVFTWDCTFEEVDERDETYGWFLGTPCKKTGQNTTKARILGPFNVVQLRTPLSEIGHVWFRHSAHHNATLKYHTVTSFLDDLMETVVILYFDKVFPNVLQSIRLRVRLSEI